MTGFIRKIRRRIYEPEHLDPRRLPSADASPVKSSSSKLLVNFYIAPLDRPRKPCRECGCDLVAGRYYAPSELAAPWRGYCEGSLGIARDCSIVPQWGAVAQLRAKPWEHSPQEGCGCILVAWASPPAKVPEVRRAGCPCQRSTASITGHASGVVPRGALFSGEPSSGFRIRHRLAGMPHRNMNLTARPLARKLTDEGSRSTASLIDSIRNDARQPDRLTASWSARRGD